MKDEKGCGFVLPPSSWLWRSAPQSCLHPFFLAFATQTEDRKVIQVGEESVISPQRFFERGEDALVDFDHRVAVAAEQVVVMWMLMNFILHAPLTEIGRVDEIEARQQIECAIDGGLVEVGITFAHARKDVVSREMFAALADNREDHFALRRQAVPLAAQLLQKLRVMHNSNHSLLRLVATRIPRTGAFVNPDFQPFGKCG